MATSECSMPTCIQMTNSALVCSVDGGYRSEIGGAFIIQGGTLLHQVSLRAVRVAQAFTLVGAEIKGDCVLSAADDLAGSVGGAASLSGSSISGVIRIHGQQIGQGLDLSGCRAKAVYLDGRVCAQGGLNLTSSRIIELHLSNVIPEAVMLRGANIDDLEVPGDRYVALLAADREFSKDSYLAIEKQLRDKGENLKADEVYVAMRRRNRKKKEWKRHWLTRPLDAACLDWLISYGTSWLKSSRPTSNTACSRCQHQVDPRAFSKL